MYAFQIGKNILPLSRKDLYKLKVSFVLLNSFRDIKLKCKFLYDFFFPLQTLEIALKSKLVLYN